MEKCSGGYILLEGASEGLWGTPHTLFSKIAYRDSILSEQLSPKIGDNICLLPLQVQYVARIW